MCVGKTPPGECTNYLGVFAAPFRILGGVDLTADGGREVEEGRSGDWPSTHRTEDTLLHGGWET